MAAGADPIELKGQAGERLVISVRGRLDLKLLHRLLDKAERASRRLAPRRVVVDLSESDYVDSSGALALALLKQRADGAGQRFELRGASEQAKSMLELIDLPAVQAPPLLPESRDGSPIEQVGAGLVGLAQDVREMVNFIGQLTLAFAYVIARPRSLRWGDVLLYMQRVGVEGLPVISLISLLLGLIITFLSALQLKPFGATTFVANLVAIGMVWELGPIMTAILVAGRSGSAFAAEIGTMKVNEEVDALEVMGFNPVVFLALPKVIAAVIVVPFLVLFADVVALAGGLVVGVMSLNLTVSAYVDASMGALRAVDVINSLWKSMAFALLIAGIGCQRGFTTHGGADSVGRATTSAVVAALFLIILADSLFALILYT